MTIRHRAPALSAAAFLALGGLAAGLSACSKRSSSMSVLSTTPAAGTRDVSPDVVVRVVFSAPVNEETITADSFRVQGSESGAAAGRLSYDDPSRTASFDPSADFKDGEEVKVEVGGSIRGKSGAGLRGHSFSFHVRPAVAPPPPPTPPPEGKVVARNPAPYSAADDDSTVYIEFSERMDALTFSSHTVGLEGSLSGRIAIQIADIAITGTRLAVLPRRRFLPGEWITVRLGRGLRTAAGGGFPGEVYGFRARASAPLEARLPGPTTALGGVAAHLELADFDADGVLDLLHAVAGESRLRLARGLGGGRFETRGSLDVARPVLAIAVADLNADGLLDVLAGAVDRVAIFRGQGAQLGFTEAEFFPTGTAVRGIAVADLDRDGPLDVVLDTDRGLRLYRDGLAGAPALTSGEARLAGTGLIARDLDLDGDLDLLHGGAGGAQLVLHRGGGAHGLLPPETVPLAGNALWVEADDLDAALPPEILVHTASAQSMQLEILAPPPPPGGGGGNAPDLEPLDPDAQRRFALGDLDGDGLRDLVAIDPEGAAVLLHENQGGSFDLDAPTELAGTLVVQRAAIGDLTGDGVLDLVLASGAELRTLLSEGGAPPPPPAQARLAVDAVEAGPGDAAKKTVVRLSANFPVEGFTVVLAHDPRAMAVEAVDLEGTAAATLLPEFVAPVLRPEEGFVALAATFDLLPPFDPRAIDPGSDLPLVNVRFRVPADAPAGVYALDLKDGLGTPPLSNGLVRAGSTVAPELVDGTLTVTAPPPPNPSRISVSPVETVVGTLGARADVLLTCAEGVEAFSLVVAYDPAATRVTRFDLAATVTGPLAPEFVVPSIREAQGFFAYSVIFDFTPPFDGQRIPPGEDQVLVGIVFDVPEGTPPGEHRFIPRNDQGDPPLSNTLVSGGGSTTIFPDLTAGVVTVLDRPPPPPPELFLRGDVNGSGRVDISDFIYLINYLYRQGDSPPCLDAADADDNGLVNLTDGVLLLDYNFKGRTPPLSPFPLPGPDPTADDTLGCLVGV